MGKTVDQYKLENDILLYMRTYGKTYAKVGSVQITKKAKGAMEIFYNNYTPKFYNRTEDLKKNSYIRYYHNRGNVYYGGVRITSENMSPYYTGGIMSSEYTDALTVAQLAWHGYHGDPTGYNGKFEPIYTTPTPLDIVREFINNEYVIEFIAKSAAQKAAKQRYTYLKF